MREDEPGRWEISARAMMEDTTDLYKESVKKEK